MCVLEAEPSIVVFQLSNGRFCIEYTMKDIKQICKRWILVWCQHLQNRPSATYMRKDCNAPYWWFISLVPLVYGGITWCYIVHGNVVNSTSTSMCVVVWKWQVRMFITQPSIYRVIVHFLLCHESLNYWWVNKFNYWLALYHGLVTCFPVKNT